LRIFLKFVEKFQFPLKSDRRGTSREVQYTFCIISRSILLIMTHISDKSCRANQNTHVGQKL